MLKECSRHQIAKGDYTKPNTTLGVIIANNPMDLMCIDYTKLDPLKDVKENILVLTDAFTKFSQAFGTPNQKVITIAKILVDRWFYVYGIPACIHSNKGCSLTMRSGHICMPCMGLRNLLPCPTICVEMLPQKD